MCNLAPSKASIEKQRRCEVRQAFLPAEPDTSLTFEDSDENLVVVASGSFEGRLCRHCRFFNIYKATEGSIEEHD